HIKPRALTHSEIKEIVEGFKQGARRANEAGYDILELHGAHGYLIHSFLSPISNTRTDEYGGEFGNRIRFLLQIIEGVLKVWPFNKPLFIRLSSTDWMDDEGGWSLEETVNLAHILKSKGVDLIDASSGGSSPNQKIKVEPYYQVPFSQKIKKNVSILTGTVGLITNAKIANEILEEGKADLIYIGRELLKNPGFIKQSAAKEFNLKIQWPQNYNYIQGKI
ncbi:FMN-linked oxidoreductase, partial [Conidiobolus coronatus NRRL 28638]